MKRQKSLFTFESFCIILANSFFKNCLTCVKVQFLQQESKQTFENLKSKKRDCHFQTEVVVTKKSESKMHDCEHVVPVGGHEGEPLLEPGQGHVHGSGRRAGNDRRLVA